MYISRLPLPRQHKHKADHVAMLVRQTKKAISYRCLENPAISSKDAYMASVQETLDTIGENFSLFSLVLTSNIAIATFLCSALSKAGMVLPNFPLIIEGHKIRNENFQYDVGGIFVIVM